MGTSASYSTPAGGQWSSVKRQVAAVLSGGSTSATAATIAGRTTAASGGLSFQRDGGGGGGGGGGVTRNRIAGVVSGVGGFGGAVRDNGLDAALAGLGLDSLRGRPAAEVASAVSEYLARDTEGLDAEFLQSALTDALLEAASLGDELGYDDFTQGLEEFVTTEGPEGLVQLFLEHYVFNALWARIEQHAVDRSSNAGALESLMTGVKGECDAQVRAQIEATRVAGRFENVDWFGRAGRELGMRIVRDIESRLSALSHT